MARQPRPVQTSATRVTPALGPTHGSTCVGGIVRGIAARDEDPLVDVKAQAPEPGLPGYVGRGDVVDEPPREGPQSNEPTTPPAESLLPGPRRRRSRLSGEGRASSGSGAAPSSRDRDNGRSTGALPSGPGMRSARLRQLPTVTSGRESGRRRADQVAQERVRDARLRDQVADDALGRTKLITIDMISPLPYATR